MGTATTTLVIAALAAGGVAASAAPASSGSIDPARFSSRVDHPLVPLATVQRTVLAGIERDPDTGRTTELRVVSRSLGRTTLVAGVRVSVVEVKDYENGELHERTHDYFAQHDDGSVWYFGERVNDIEDGQVVGHGGQWLAGQDGAQPGLFMPARPKLGDVFEQERAPGVAEDRSRVIATGLTITVAAGTFRKCIRTRDFDPISKAIELKVYCPGVGLVREKGADSVLELVSYR
jgi:hypothetical protein